MKKIFIFEIKKLLVPLSIYFGIMTILGTTIMLVSNYLSWTSFMILFGVYMLVLVFGVIFLTFSYNKKRISADMTYSLPVTKRELFIGKYLAAITIVTVMAIGYLLVCLIVMALAKAYGKFDNYLKYQSFNEQLGCFTLSCLIQMSITIPLLNFILLFYYKANTILDGITFIGFGLALVFLIAQTILNIAEEYADVFLLSLYVKTPSLFLNTPYAYQDKVASIFYPIFYTYIVLGYLILIYLFWFSKKDCSIRTQGICNGIFGYKVFLPLFGVLIPILIVSNMGWDSFELIWYILTAVGLFIGYCVYHRGVKFSKLSYIVYAATLGFDFIFLILWIAR